MYYVLSIKYRIFKKYFLILLLILTTYYLLHSTLPASAQTMSNQDYIIKTENVETVSDTNSTSDNEVKPATENLNLSISGKVNLPFSISLSSDVVDFGILSPTNPIIRTVNLSVDSLSTNGYSVIVSENHPLKNEENFIPDTTCDNGECSEEESQEWTNTLTYGFGYRCDNVIGLDCHNSFTKTNFYKHFADISNIQYPQSIMNGLGSKKSDVRISYKVNISGNQAKDSYSNTVTYIAVPNF